MRKAFSVLTMMSLAVASLTAVVPASAADAGKTVYLITMDKMDQHWVKVDEGAKTMAKALGVNYKWDAPDVKDNAKQIEAVNNAVADKAGLILLAANDPKAISAVVKNAQAKGVKIIYVDSGADAPAIATLSTNNFQAGALAGKTMVTSSRRQARPQARSVSSASIRQPTRPWNVKTASVAWSRPPVTPS